MRAFKWLLAVMMVGVVASCAVAPEYDGQVSPERKSQAKQETTNQHVEDLSEGKSVTVKTSQGNIDVEPTIVAVTDAQAKSDLQVDKFYYDPWEGLNRPVFVFNHHLYRFVLIPVSDGYRYLVPAVVRDKISNVFDNIREPLNFINNLFAGEVDEAVANVGRFLLNSTVGLLGLFDPAADWFGIPEHKQTISDTLQRYEIGSGPYLILPILGPSDIRGVFSIVVEGYLHPVNQFVQSPESFQLRFFDGFDDFSNQSQTYQQLYKQVKDPYIYFRNQYIQGKRRDELFQYDNEQQQVND